MSIEKNKLYELPWKMNNCPNGWIEPTTFCNLKCPHCYRACDKTESVPVHRELEEMKKEVDNLIKDKNIQTVSISGGEPLMYPRLPELISYIKNKGLNILLFTNGVLLDEKKLLELRDLKVDTILLHIDNYQNRSDIKSVKDVNNLRAKYCEMFRKVREVNLGFIMPVSKDNLVDLPEILNFCRRNADVISLVDFTTMNDLFSYEKGEFKSRANLEEISQKVKEIYGIEYCAYIGKVATDKISWLWGSAVFSGETFLGSADGKIVKIIQEDCYKKHGRYLYVGTGIPKSPMALAKILFNKSLRKIFLNYLKLRNKEKINWQIILIIDSPLVVGDKLDMCKCCPNAMYFKGKLVPSCCYSRIIDDADEYAKNIKCYCEDYN